MRQSLPLRRLDAALAREVMRLRTRYQLSLDEFRGLYISDEQVDALLRQVASVCRAEAELPRREPHPAIDAVAGRFNLDAAATDILLLALAPDVDPFYCTLIAYLNDDARRRWPTVDLAQRLFGFRECAEALAPAGALFGPGLLLAQEGGEPRVPLPLREFTANPVLAAYVLGEVVAGRPGLGMDLHGEKPFEGGDPGPFGPLTPAMAAGERPLVILRGATGDELALAARRLARLLGRPLTRLSLAEEPNPAALMRDGLLAARLASGLLLVEADLGSFVAAARALREPPVPVLLMAPAAIAGNTALAGIPAVQVTLDRPDAAARRRIWACALQGAGLFADAPVVSEVADRFRLSEAQIDAAARSLRLGLGLGPGERGAANAVTLKAAARDQAEIELGGLAQRVVPKHGWDDLVLPDAAMRQLRQLSGAIRHRELVYSEWGFGGGPGITALFSGSPGTGKSMSACVLAREAMLDLWRIDLSALVSKYVGETEKHLDRVFALAHDGNAILFFDEADALFGKRSEVKDAHDQFANIEVAFLLQRLEVFEGVVILASNLARNLDQAFSRRLHFVIDFPLPDALLRERLWRAAIAPGAPLADDVDLEFLASQFAFAGGDIRVAALDAAFAAAADGEAIDMARLVQAVSRQLLKQGKVPTASEFRRYHALLAAGPKVCGWHTARSCA